MTSMSYIARPCCLLIVVAVVACMSPLVVRADGFGDFDCNCVRDLDDFKALFDCMGGPGLTPAPMPPTDPEYCVTVFSLDDEDVDLYDFYVLRFFYGTTLPTTPPTAVLDVSTTGVLAGDPVTFDATASHDAETFIAHYLWDFDDGATSTNGFDTHAFAGAGDYQVTLHVTDSCNQTNSTGVQITVEEPLPEDLSGTYAISPYIYYECAVGIVTVDFGTVTITDNNPNVTVNPVPYADQPGTMTGTIYAPGQFVAYHEIPGEGICTETYTLEATFISGTQFTGIFTMAFEGPFCEPFGCTLQAINVTGTLAE